MISKKIFQKLNEIHRRRLSHWNCHTDTLTFVARSHHCHQALAMINNATSTSAANDSLVNWIVLWTRTHPILLVKALRPLIQLQWLSDRFMFNPDCIFCHSDRCKKVKKAHYWTKVPLSKFEFGGGETVIRTAEAKNNIMIFFYGSKDRTFVLVKTGSTQVVWKGAQQTHNYGTVWM